MWIATRELKYEAETGVSISVPISILPPKQNDMDWGCQYSIGWPNGVELKTVYGIDSMQALVLAIQSIGSSLYASDYHKTGRLKWEKPRYGYGFPVSNIIRGLLIGSDKANDG